MIAPLLLTGANGQLGSTFKQYWNNCDLVDNYELHLVDIDSLDLTDESAVKTFLENLQPRLVLNAAAYTSVDKAELDRDRAYAVNQQAAANLARWCARAGAAMIQISTDFVFDGKAAKPYRFEADTGPLSVYGASKLAGEKEVQSILPERCSVVRTSWLYSEYGSNFVKTMLHLMAERDQLGIVGDQIGSPTSTHSLVKFLHTLISTNSVGNHFHWTDGGEVSWYEFAVAIQNAGLEAGLLREKIPIKALSSADYPTAAKRPEYSVLSRDNALAIMKIQPCGWQEELSNVIDALAHPCNNQKEGF